MEGAGQMKAGFALSLHKFINRLGAGVVETINSVKEIEAAGGAKLTGRSESGSKISLVVLAQQEFADVKEKEAVDKQVKSLVSQLKNPASLLGLLDK